jgi:hypothetical protein
VHIEAVVMTKSAAEDMIHYINIEYNPGVMLIPYISNFLESFLYKRRKALIHIFENGWILLWAT